MQDVYGNPFEVNYNSYAASPQVVDEVVQELIKMKFKNSEIITIMDRTSWPVMVGSLLKACNYPVNTFGLLTMNSSLHAFHCHVCLLTVN